MSGPAKIALALSRREAEETFTALGRAAEALPPSKRRAAAAARWKLYEALRRDDARKGTT